MVEMDWAGTDFMISAKLIASSTPGIANARSCIMLPIIPFESAGRQLVYEECVHGFGHVHWSTISWIELEGSISIADRLSKPFTFVASLENFWPNASDRLCAGSVLWFRFDEH